MSGISQKAARRAARKASENGAKKAVGSAAATVAFTTIAAGASIVAVGAVLDYLFSDVVEKQKELDNGGK